MTVNQQNTNDSEGRPMTRLELEPLLGLRGHKTITAASGLTSAPRATRVSMRTAVSTVMCRQPAMRAPFRGLEVEYISRMCIRPGISFSARSRALRPQAGRVMSAAGAGWTEVHELLHPINREAPATLHSSPVDSKH